MIDRNGALARDIYNWCKKKGLWGDNCIYFNGKAWASWSKWGDENGNEIDENLYEYMNKNPIKYFEYANPETVSMSYEGALNHVLNGYVSGWVKLEDEFLKLFEKYGYYAEYGDAWNVSAYEL